MAHITIITTGGTIASVPQDNGDVRAVLKGGDLLRGLSNTSDISVEECVTLGSYAFTFDTLYRIGLRVQSLLASEDVGGIVLTHGTDTMEETAFYLSVVTNREKPIVLTGAQLDASHPSSDGPRNLADAIQVARFQKAASWGPVIVFAGFIYASREVKKLDTNAMEAFGAPGWGPVGRVDLGRVYFSRTVREYPTVPLAAPRPVVLIRLGLGMTGDEVKRLAQGYEGIVIQAYGRGNAHPSVASAVGDLVQRGIPVIVTTRCISGAVAPIYGDGGGRDLERNGAWFVGDLSGEKARILLGLMLANQMPMDQMERILQAYRE